MVMDVAVVGVGTGDGFDDGDPGGVATSSMPLGWRATVLLGCNGARAEGTGTGDAAPAPRPLQPTWELGSAAQ